MTKDSKVQFAGKPNPHQIPEAHVGVQANRVRTGGAKEDRYRREKPFCNGFKTNSHCPSTRVAARARALS